MFIIDVCVCLINMLLLSQVLAIASNEKRDAMKLLHVPSGTIFSNWPTERTPIRYPFSLDFSPNGSFLAVGNDRGRVLLYRYVECLYG
jgi:U3 small nucleolar RNA-associated protein 18